MNANDTRNETALGVSYDAALDVGARLRAARERLGRTPSGIAARIKIREHYITAIEQGQWNELPPGLNGRGLVRIYARDLAVNVPELEPRMNPTASHPQYEPAVKVSVISRQALMERELARASQEIARSAPRNSGGTLYGVRGSAARIPLPRTPQGSLPPDQLASARSQLEPRAQEIIQRNTSATLGRLSDRDDESPLDVVTPDVASILGLTEQDIGAQRVPLKPVALPPLSEGIPAVSAELMAAEMFGGAVDAHADFGDAPETAPLSRLFPDAPSSVSAAASQSDGPLPLEDHDSANIGTFAATPASTPATPAAVTTGQGIKESRKDRQRREAAELADRRAADNRSAAGRAVAARAEAERMVAQRAAADRAVRDREAADRATLERAASERAAHYSQAVPATLPAAPATDEQARWQRNTAITIPVGLGAIDEAAPTRANGSAASGEANAEATASLAAMAASLHAGTVGSKGRANDAAARSGSWPQSGVNSDAAKPVSGQSGRTTARGLSAKTLFTYTAVALAVVGLGAAFLAPKRRVDSSENGAVIDKSGDADTVAASARAGDVQATASAVSQTPPSVVAVEVGARAADPAAVAQPAEAVTAAPAAQAAAVVAPSLTPAALAPAQGAPVAAPVQDAPVAAAEASAQNAETSILGTGSATSAKLTLTGDVEVQVTADGKRIFSGVQQAGVLSINFTRSAEIFVGDGSKAKLSYGTWDHGPLGHDGRKRRILLNAGSFTPPAAAP